MTHITRLIIGITAIILSSQCLAAANPELFPRPAGIEPAVQFWTRVFTEIDTKSGFIHDDRYLGVIYESINLPDTKSRRKKQKYVDSVKKQYIKILNKLAKGKRTGLSKKEQRVLDLWPKDVSNKTLKQATKRLRFQLGQANKYKEGLIRSGAWKKHILKTLDDMGLPKEIASLPHVESSFNPNAYSRVGAAGLWQFTRSTGRRFLRIDHVVDERMDPFKASVAAARLLENNYSVTGTWPLALTAYNHGAAGMRNAARQTGTTDIETIINKYRSRSFKFASRNFYVAFLAAVDVEQNSEKYFGPVTLNPEVKDEMFNMPGFMDAPTLASALGVTTSYLKKKNPALRSSVWNGNKYIPRGYQIRFDKDKVNKNAKQALAKITASQMYAKQKPDLYHRVRRGQTLSTIAARYGVRVKDIMALNNIRSKHRIRAGQVLRLPQPGGGKRATMLASASKVPQPLPSNGKVTVRRGDTITRIAKRYGLSTKKLLAYNDLNKRSTIYPGQSLSIKPKSKITDTQIIAASMSKTDAQETNVISEVINEHKAEKIPLQTALIPTEQPNTVTLDSATDTTTSTEINKEMISAVEQTVQSANVNASKVKTPDVETIESDSSDSTTPADDELETVALLESKQPVEPKIPPIPQQIVPNPSAEIANEEETPDTQPAAEDILPTEASQLDVDDSQKEPVDESTEEELPADPSDYSVGKNNTIEVQAAETLGHYAEWLGIRASQLRRINKMRYGKPVVIGKRIKLSFKKVSHDEFERQRKEYHRILQEAFFEQNKIAGKDKHKIRRGESIWHLAKRKYHVPIWLLRQYNPDLSFQKVRPGMYVNFPKVEQRSINDDAPSSSANS